MNKEFLQFLKDLTEAEESGKKYRIEFKKLSGDNWLSVEKDKGSIVFWLNRVYRIVYGPFQCYAILYKCGDWLVYETRQDRDDAMKKWGGDCRAVTLQEVEDEPGGQ